MKNHLQTNPKTIQTPPVGGNLSRRCRVGVGFLALCVALLTLSVFQIHADVSPKEAPIPIAIQEEVSSPVESNSASALPLTSLESQATDVIARAQVLDSITPLAQKSIAKISDS